MNNVLIIVHLPRASPRIEGLVRYLPDFGWLPIILTGVTSEYTDLPARIVQTPYRDALGFMGRLLKIDPEKDAGQQIKNRLGVTSRKSPIDYFLTLGGAIINYPCPDKNWKPFALQATREMLQKENIDAIISSSAPVVSHLISSRLKEDYNIPWIADLRDLWSQNHNYSYGPLRRFLDRRLELKTLAKADALVTVSEPWAEKLRTLHKGKTVYEVTHGFNPAEVNVPPAKLTLKFTITHTGSIYSRKHDPVKLFAALRDLISGKIMDQNDIEVRFYGTMADWVDKEIKEYGLTDIIRQYGQVPKDVAVGKQRESQVLYITKWRDLQERGAYSGKIFEYLAARRPILAADGSYDVVTDLLNETKAGIDAQSVQDIKDALEKLYQDYKLKGELSFNGIDSKINNYSHREMARKFSEILNRLAPS